MSFLISSAKLALVWGLVAWLVIIAITAIIISLPNRLLVSILSRQALKIIPNDINEIPFDAADQLNSPCQGCNERTDFYHTADQLKCHYQACNYNKSSCSHIAQPEVPPSHQTVAFLPSDNEQDEQGAGETEGEAAGQAGGSAGPAGPDPDDAFEAQIRERIEGSISNKVLDFLGWVFRPSNKSQRVQKAEIIDPVTKFLTEELSTPDLDTIAPCLWIMTTTNGKHITPLHQQLVKRRQIVLSENPLQHLTWFDQRVFLKPIPLWLFSYAVWDRFLVTGAEEDLGLRGAAIGFLRSYYGLIKHESDFKLAIEHQLIPGTADISWTKFKRFINNFSFDIEKDRVSPRYAFTGEIKLGRIDFWIWVLLGKNGYADFHWCYKERFGKYNLPLILLFAFFSLVLNAMLVEMAAEDANKSNPLWSRSHGSIDAFRWFSVTSFFVTFIAAFLILAHLFSHYVDQVFYVTGVYHALNFLWDRLVYAWAERLVMLVVQGLKVIVSPWPKAIWHFTKKIVQKAKRWVDAFYHWTGRLWESARERVKIIIGSTGNRREVIGV